ncbi:uncharacterized protein LOC143856915 [Tasmannia lanceolata]|uniref:uncharacterized protein LOC143856915 n=1 Tax=Tasmannia lanceolata TaxID=3420 RepID=UPI004063792A
MGKEGGSVLEEKDGDVLEEARVGVLEDLVGKEIEDVLKKVALTITDSPLQVVDVLETVVVTINDNPLEVESTPFIINIKDNPLKRKQAEAPPMGSTEKEVKQRTTRATTRFKQSPFDVEPQTDEQETKAAPKKGKRALRVKKNGGGRRSAAIQKLIKYNKNLEVITCDDGADDLYEL